MSYADDVQRFTESVPPVSKADSREGFSKGDRVHHATPPADFPDDGIVQCWETFEYAPTVWRCVVTWGGKYIGRYEAHEIEHA